MSDIKALNFCSFLQTGVSQVFSTMLSMDVQTLGGDCPSRLEGDRIIGSVGFAGAIMGSITIEVERTFAGMMTAAMLGIEPDEVGGEEDVFDVLGEVSNMIGGNLKSRLCDTGFPCELSIPSIVAGRDFNLESRDWSTHECLAFRHQDHLALVNVYVKSIS